MLNKVTLIGRLGRDPEVRHTQAGDRVINIGYLRQDGNIAKRQGWQHYGKPYEPENVVLFKPPTARAGQSPLPGGEGEA